MLRAHYYCVALGMLGTLLLLGSYMLHNISGHLAIREVLSIFFCAVIARAMAGRDG